MRKRTLVPLLGLAALVTSDYLSKDFNPLIPTSVHADEFEPEVINPSAGGNSVNGRGEGDANEIEEEVLETRKTLEADLKPVEPEELFKKLEACFDSSSPFICSYEPDTQYFHCSLAQSSDYFFVGTLEPNLDPGNENTWILNVETSKGTEDEDYSHEMLSQSTINDLCTSIRSTLEPGLSEKTHYTSEDFVAVLEDYNIPFQKTGENRFEIDGEITYMIHLIDDETATLQFATSDQTPDDINVNEEETIKISINKFLATIPLAFEHIEDQAYQE